MVESYEVFYRLPYRRLCPRQEAVNDRICLFKNSIRRCIMETRDGSETFLLETFLSLFLNNADKWQGKMYKKNFSRCGCIFLLLFFSFPFLFSPLLDGKAVVFRGHPRFLKNEARRSVWKIFFTSSFRGRNCPRRKHLLSVTEASLYKKRFLFVNIFPPPPPHSLEVSYSSSEQNNVLKRFN